MKTITVALTARINEITNSKGLKELPGQYQLFCRRQGEYIQILLILRTDQPSQILETVLEKETVSAKILWSRIEPSPNKQQLNILFLDDLVRIIKGFTILGFYAAADIENGFHFDNFDHIDEFNSFDIYDDLNADLDFRATSINKMLQNSLSKKPLEMLFGNVAKGDLCITFGREKTGKSIFLTQLAHCLTQGLPILPDQPYQKEKLRIQYLDGEMSDLEWRSRYTSNKEQTDFFNFDSERFVTVFEGEQLKGKSRTAKLIALLNKMQLYFDRRQFDVLIIDNLGIYLEDETNTSEITDVLSRINDFRKKNNITVIVAHHITKLPGTEPITTDSMRGSGRISDYAGSFIALNKTLSGQGYIKLLRSRNSKGSGDQVYPYEVVKDKNFTSLKIDGNLVSEQSLLKSGAASVYSKEDVQKALVSAKKRIDLSEPVASVYRELNEKGYPIGSINTFKSKLGQL